MSLTAGNELRCAGAYPRIWAFAWVERIAGANKKAPAKTSAVVTRGRSLRFSRACVMSRPVWMCIRTDASATTNATEARWFHGMDLGCQAGRATHVCARNLSGTPKVVREQSQRLCDFVATFAVPGGGALFACPSQWTLPSQ